jgi:hypothetical protein
MAAIHRSQLDPALLSALVEAGLALWPMERFETHFYSDTLLYLSRSHSIPNYPGLTGSHADDDPVWVVMHERLVSLYCSVLAEEFAVANRLRPTTDQPHAFSLTNRREPARLAADLGAGSPPDHPPTHDLAEVIGLLALDLVVPDRLDSVPVEKIIEIRRRHGEEFLAFSRLAEQAAEGLGDLAGIRDRSVLEQYLGDMVAQQFMRPLDQLRRALRSSKLDAATTAVNIKSELPASLTVAGGAWLSGHPLVAGIGTAAAGVMAIGRSVSRQRADLRHNAPEASYLLHTQTHIKPHALLERSMQGLGRIATARVE